MIVGSYLTELNKFSVAILTNDALQAAKLEHSLFRPSLSERPTRILSGKVRGIKDMQVRKSGTKFVRTKSGFKLFLSLQILF